jgi:hypothetical protein
MLVKDRYKLGKLSPKIDPRTIRYSAIRRDIRIDVPETCHWETKISDWGVMGNSDYGNCVIATAGHCLLDWRANDLNDLVRITDSAVIALSEEMGALDGYYILDRNKYWQKEGMWGNKLDAFASIDSKNFDIIKEVVFAFGCADIGLAMPAAWSYSDIWDVGSGRSYKPYSWGGHSVPIVGYDVDYVYVITWGCVQRITWEALAYYCDEAYCLLNRCWTNEDSIAPSIIDLTSLSELLQQVRSDD